VSESNPIRVFVTHTFQQSEDYMRVFEFLESMERFFYTNCSKPENMPEMGYLDSIKEELIAIRPFGGLSESPPDLVSRVNEHIEWNEREIADSLKRQGRLEQTSRWETIEFTLD